MFDLEKSIAEWQQQMLAVGINTPVPLEELESHLREEIDQRLQSGAREQQAFEAATAEMGQARLLKTEFAKVERRFGLVGEGKSTKTDRVLGVLWAAGCLWSLITLELWFISPFTMTDPLDTTRFPLGNPPEIALFILNGLVVVLYVAGIIGGMFLFRSAGWGYRIIRIVSFLLVIACVWQVLNFAMPPAWRMWCGFVAIFGLVSIGILQLPKNRDPSPARI